MTAVAQASLATAAFIGLLWALVRARAAAGARLRNAAARRLRAIATGDAPVTSSGIETLLSRLLTAVTWTVGGVLTYVWLTFVFRRFPITQTWGDELRDALLGRMIRAAVAFPRALPDLFSILLILLITRFVTRVVSAVFTSAADGRIKIPGVFPETAEPTRRLVTIGLWLFAGASTYPFLPGSESNAFKGVSLLVGLVVSLGSTGLVNQLMSGLTLTYSRAMRPGDFVAVGEVQGTVTELGTLATKIMTPRGEDVTIPNAVIVSNTVVNYSRLDGVVLVPTDVTIGYDTPWRQVEALLLLAAARSEGVRRDPAPVVRQVALEDPYVRYRLLFCLERPADRPNTLAIVHSNILDAFNEYGVQIMSPRYVGDPAGTKVVPLERWFSAPATPRAASERDPSAT